VTEKLDPRKFPYRVQGWVGNTICEPAEIGVNDFDVAVDAARALARGSTFYRTSVLDQSNLEWAHFVNPDWGKQT